MNVATSSRWSVLADESNDGHSSHQDLLNARCFPSPAAHTDTLEQDVPNTPSASYNSRDISDLQELLQEQDELIWEGSQNGKITVRDALEDCRVKNYVCSSWRGLWRQFIPPRISVFCWKVLYDRLPSAAVLHKQNMLPAPVYLACISGQNEDTDHVFLHCHQAANVWNWIHQLTGKNFQAMGRMAKIIMPGAEGVWQLMLTCWGQGIDFSVWELTRLIQHKYITCFAGLV